MKTPATCNKKTYNSKSQKRGATATDPIDCDSAKPRQGEKKVSNKAISKLKVYAGTEHPHAAQQPKPFPDFI